MYNLIEYSNNYSKTSGSLWQYYRDEPNYNIANSKSLPFNVKITGKSTDNDNKKKKKCWNNSAIKILK